MTSVARLTSSREIRAIFAGRISAGSPIVVAHGALDPADHDRHARVAVVAGRRVGNAVARNRAKRRLRAALQQVTLPSGVDLVVTAKPDTNAVSFPALANELDAVLRRLVTRLERRS